MAGVAVVRNRFTLNPYTGKENLKMRKSFGGRVRLLAVMAFMLFSIFALSLPIAQPADASPVVADFCFDCTTSCYNESQKVYLGCISSSTFTSIQQCEDERLDYYFRCKKLFCGTCDSKFLPVGRPGDN